MSVNNDHTADNNITEAENRAGLQPFGSYLLILIPSLSLSLAPAEKHDVSGNRTVPPFPEGTEMAMFGKCLQTRTRKLMQFSLNADMT